MHPRPEVERSLALHRQVATMWSSHPEWRAASLARIDRWEAQNALHPAYASAWRDWLTLPNEELCARIVASGDTAESMRQTSPLTCNLHRSVRWRILKALRRASDT